VSEVLARLRQALLEADEARAIEETRRLLGEGVDPREILESGMAAAMSELGQRWNRGEVFLPEVVAAAEIFKKCSELGGPGVLGRAGASPRCFSSLISKP